MPMFRVRLTRLIEQEAFVYARGRDAGHAVDLALDDLAEAITESVWTATAGAEATSLSAEIVKEGSHGEHRDGEQP